MRVDGLAHVRVHGRRGQDQGGLDLFGGPIEHRRVYQVRRIQALPAQALRNAVADYLVERRFEARRFVLVAGCPVTDEQVDRALLELQREHHDDLDITLWDATELSRMLRDRGPLVAGIFGPEWARACCGYHPPTSEPIPT